MKVLKSNGKIAKFYPLTDPDERLRIESELSRIHQECLTTDYKGGKEYYGMSAAKAMKNFIETDHVQYSSTLYQFASDEEGFEIIEI
jgi:GTP cyclohydrolase II